MGAYRALIVACDFYTEDFAPIPHTVNEAKALGETLFTYGYEPFEPRYHLDDINANVQETMGRFFTSASPDDFVLFYFGGHGRKDDDGELYLVLRDTILKELITTGLSASTLSKLISKCPAQKKVIVLDACYSAAIEQGSRSDHQQIGVERRIQQGKGTAILTSANSVQLAYSREDRRSFTYFLTEGLRTGKADKNQDGNISLDEWFEYAYEGVLSWQPGESIQNPQMFYKLKEGLVYIGQVRPEEEEDLPIPQIPHSSAPPLKCGLELIKRAGTPYLSLILMNPNNFELTSVEIHGFTAISSRVLQTIERMSMGESMTVTVPFFSDTGQLLQLVINAKDAYGRSFVPAQIQISQLPTEKPASGINDPGSYTGGVKTGKSQRETSTAQFSDDEDESVLNKKKKKAFH